MNGFKVGKHYNEASLHCMIEKGETDTWVSFLAIVVMVNIDRSALLTFKSGQ